MSSPDSLTSSQDVDIINAKAFLQQQSSKNGESLYDHLTRLLTKILNERPNDAADVFEDLSRKVKVERFVSSQDNIIERPEKNDAAILAETHLKLITNGGEAGQMEEEETVQSMPNLLEQHYYFEQAGVGLSAEEYVRLWLAMKALVLAQPIETIRFWGKIIGTRRNYFIVEIEFREGEGDEEEPEVDEGNDEMATNRDNDEVEEGEAEVDIIPKPVFKPPPVIPKEDNRTGVNKKTYFVCNEPGEPWIRLPQLTPVQISTARKIKKFFTGDLDAPIVSYPPFPGNESNYLRAQIARISAGTHISPVGFYQFDEDEEEDSSGNRSHVVVNAEYEPLPVRDLADPSNWVHHVLHILPQGRTRWWNPVQKSSGDQDNEDEEEEREDQEEIEPEVGPPLLTPLSEDAELCTMSPWSAQISSKLIPQYSVAVIHSSLWPGAHTFGTGRQFENIYVGWGHKYSPESYGPPPMAAVQNEYSTGPEITEASDPTPEEEAALRAETAPNAGLDADEDGEQDGGPNGQDDEMAEDDEEED